MDKIKSVITGVLAVLSGFFGVLYIPVLLLVSCNIIDYITGLMASKYRGNAINSNVGFKGIVKKVCMWLLVLIGAMVDMILVYAQDYVGIDLKINFVIALLVTFWLLMNEFISILENINDMGVKLPPFLLPIIKNIKTQVEKKTGSDDNE